MTLIFEGKDDSARTRARKSLSQNSSGEKLRMISAPSSSLSGAHFERRRRGSAHFDTHESMHR